MSVRVELPWPPSVNSYWQRGRSGHTFLSKKARQFKKDVKAAVVIRAIPVQLGRLSVKLSLYPPDRRRRDIDNHAKGTLDALENAGVFADDEQIDDLHIMRGEIIKGGLAIVEITEIKPTVSEAE